MRITGDWLDHPGTRAVCQTIEAGGFRALFVGGCVRDAVLDRPVGDIDIATDASPEDVMALAKAAGIRAVPTGVDHGTVMLVAHGLPHEVTTFRRDVQTDGRHAVVQFSTDVAVDAARRDFTMNALYATPTGEVVDPLGGLPDLKARRLRFVGDPAARIAEDYLRILRFFRFFAWYGDPAEGMDAEALSAIAEGADGLESLSKERLGQEMRKLLSAPDPSVSVAVMRQTGVLPHVLPGADDRLLPVLVHFEGEIAPDPIRRLAILGGTEPDINLRLSRDEAQALSSLKAEMAATTPPGELGYRLGLTRGRDIVLLRAALFETPPESEDLTAVEIGAKAEFPVVAADLMPQYQGPALGQKLRSLERHWIGSGFLLDRTDLLALRDD